MITPHPSSAKWLGRRRNLDRNCDNFRSVYNSEEVTMNTKQFRKLVSLAPIALVMIAWQPAPNGIPSDVCSILQVCNGAVKVVALPRSTEGGQPVLRGVFLTQDDKKTDVLVLERDTAVDRYYFLLTPQGTLAKAAYAQVGSRSR